MRFYSLVAAAALASASLAAHADTMYSYTSGSRPPSGESGSFIVTSTDFLSYSNDPVAPVSGEATGGSMLFDGPFTGIIFGESLISGKFSTQLGTLTATFFDASYDIAVDGTYTDSGGDTLTISGSPNAVAATPEPSSLALLGTGLLGALGIARKRFA